MLIQSSEIWKNQPKSAVKLISADNLDELINLLHNEAKI
jgi:electron transfer flavoprotein beta subunit